MLAPVAVSPTIVDCGSEKLKQQFYEGRYPGGYSTTRSYDTIGPVAGTLYIVATPIGNLEDASPRVLRVLGESACIACEDTRQTRKLLDRFGIATPTISYHEHNEMARTGELLARLAAGEAIALVSDAGTPLIADPGYRIVRAARQAGHRVVPIPGPSAVLAALSASGLATDSFLFLGFLPPKAKARRTLLEQRRDESATLVCFEAPHRLLDTLEDIVTVMGDRPMAAARELTKIHEEIVSGTARELKEHFSRPGAILKGEFTLVIERAPANNSTEVSDEVVRNEVLQLLETGCPRMDAIKTVARKHGLPKRAVYSLLEE
jgi:16S rRNA (cytidine1402-2'-O)-methyltransferase